MLCAGFGAVISAVAGAFYRVLVMGHTSIVPTSRYMQCPVRRRKRYNSFRGEVGEAADNVLNRQFTADTRHAKWVTDVTEFNVGTTKVYLSPVLDLHDNRVVSATAGPSPSVKMVTDSLRMAIDTLGPGETLLVYSDQGFQYRHTLWRDTLRGAGLAQSMSRKGTCLDNATMGGFFSHLKEEWFRILPLSGWLRNRVSRSRIVSRDDPYWQARERRDPR